MSATAPVHLVRSSVHIAQPAQPAHPAHPVHPAAVPSTPRREARTWPAPMPHVPTPLFGRDRETELLCNLVSAGRRRLVTLTGPGGVGKTRLALHVATALTDRFAGDIAFVSL